MKDRLVLRPEPELVKQVQFTYSHQTESCKGGGDGINRIRLCRIPHRQLAGCIQSGGLT